MYRILFMAVLGSIGISLQASPIVYNFVSGPTAGGQSVHATAAITITGSHTFTVTLNNLQPVVNAGQLLTDFEFTLAGTTVTYDPATNSNINFVNVGANGIQASTSATLGWGFGNVGGDNYLLCGTCGMGVSETASQASQGIIGPTDANTNGSIVNNQPHNPFLLSGATFSFVTGTAFGNLTAATSPFTNVVFSFGSEFGVNSPGTFEDPPNPTPEPVSILLAGAGLIGIAIVGRRFRKT